jgi:hypothetical protein
MIGYDIWIQLTFQRTNGNLVAGLDLVMILVMSCVLIYFELLTPHFLQVILILNR